MKRNIGSIDRALRIVVGLALGIAVAVGAVSGPLMWILGLVALIALGTALVNFCPLYSILGIRTSPPNEA